MLELNYGQAYSGLNFGAACIVFFKKSGELRTMLATRNLVICNIAQCSDKLSQLNYRDSHCNLRSKTMAVMDLVLGEVRAFSTEKVAYMEWLEITNPEQLDQAILRTKELNELYKSKVAEMQTLDGMDNDLGDAGKAGESQTGAEQVGQVVQAPAPVAFNIPTGDAMQVTAPNPQDEVKALMEDNPDLSKEQAEEMAAARKFAAYMRGPGLTKRKW